MSILRGESCGGCVLHTPSTVTAGPKEGLVSLWAPQWKTLPLLWPEALVLAMAVPSDNTHSPRTSLTLNSLLQSLPGELSTNDRNVLSVTQGCYEHQIRALCKLYIQMVCKIVAPLVTPKLLWSNVSCHLHVLCWNLMTSTQLRDSLFLNVYQQMPASWMVFPEV